ncbi:hypothetical protein UAO_02899 [Enterococcus villorum ATCC 700913]|uniref:Uncharacterized protein n=1 Tax=Enterococcus villorum ATCC 700913 TaxID=1158604 RepID=A0ABN0KCS5_9ENTE|nr:hypothetical protein UAO_02899 [Enterococcus villorum ATCC 700913]
MFFYYSTLFDSRFKTLQQNQLIEPQYYSPLVIVILLSTLISPLVLKYFTKKVYEV